MISMSAILLVPKTCLLGPSRLLSSSNALTATVSLIVLVPRFTGSHPLLSVTMVHASFEATAQQILRLSTDELCHWSYINRFHH